MPAKRFNLDPIPQPPAPARDRALAASPDGSRDLVAARVVPLDRLIADPGQPRKAFSTEALQALADSLAAQGMRQPITAYYDDNLERFVVISGERRLRAAHLAGLREVPVLLERRPTSESEKLVLQLAENLVREDLTPLEAAAALARLKELRPSDWDHVALRHGIGKRRAYQLIELLDDPPAIRGALERGEIREGHAAELRRVAPAQQARLLDEVVAHGLSVADTRKLKASIRDSADLAPPLAEVAPPSSDRAEPTGDPLAGRIADLIGTATLVVSEPAHAQVRGGAVLVEEKQRRDRSRRLRQRLEHIASELRNVHTDEITSEYTQLPEIIAQARLARESLDRFIQLLERVQLDRPGDMAEVPT